MSDTSNDNVKHRTALIGDSDVLTRISISGYLRECGFNVLETANADEALTVLRQPGFTIDIALLDADVSVNGFWLANWIRTNMPHINVIVASGARELSNEAEQMCEQGPMMSKPYDAAQLVERINRLLENGR